MSVRLHFLFSMLVAVLIPIRAARMNSLQKSAKK